MDMHGRIGGKCTSGLSGINGTIAIQRQTGQVRNNSYLDINKTKRVWVCSFVSVAFPDMWFKFKWDSLTNKIVDPVDEQILKKMDIDPKKCHPLEAYYIIPGVLNFDGPSNLRLRFLDDETLRIDDKLCPETWIEFQIPK